MVPGTGTCFRRAYHSMRFMFHDTDEEATKRGKWEVGSEEARKRARDEGKKQRREDKKQRGSEEASQIGSSISAIRFYFVGKPNIYSKWCRPPWRIDKGKHGRRPNYRKTGSQLHNNRMCMPSRLLLPEVIRHFAHHGRPNLRKSLDLHAIPPRSCQKESCHPASELPC